MKPKTVAQPTGWKSQHDGTSTDRAGWQRGAMPMASEWAVRGSSGGDGGGGGGGGGRGGGGAAAASGRPPVDGGSRAVVLLRMAHRGERDASYGSRSQPATLVP